VPNPTPALESRTCNAYAPVLRASKPAPKLDRRIVPDAKWAGMFRVRYPDGSLSDKVNLTRAKDALRANEPSERQANGYQFLQCQ
jgi:hypothetical protein